LLPFEGQGNFLAFLSPFLGSGAGSPAPTSSNVEGFSGLLQIPQMSKGGGSKAEQAANIAQVDMQIGP